MQNNFETTKKRALRILAKRNFSENEMYKRLVSKGEPEEASKATVEWLVELGYIDDDNYSKLIVGHYADKGYGTARIREELYKRGIKDELINERLNEYRLQITRADAGNDETDAERTNPAVEYLKNKLRGSTDEEDLRKAQGALVRRGFSYDEAKDAIRTYSDTINYDNDC